MDDRPIIVIDASVAVASLCVEEHTPMILGAIRDWSRTGTRLVVPRAFWWEVVNALAVGHRFSGVEVLEAVHELETLEIESRDLDRASLLLTISTVERFRLSAYDAQYLVLAESLDVPLATLDRALARAAGSRARFLGPGDPGHRLSEPPAVYEHAVTWPNYKGASAYLAKLRAEAARPG
jgi:Predicted nucleic acid-binding protein, contains PIN domain